MLNLARAGSLGLLVACCRLPASLQTYYDWVLVSLKIQCSWFWESWTRLAIRKPWKWWVFRVSHHENEKLLVPNEEKLDGTFSLFFSYIYHKNDATMTKNAFTFFLWFFVGMSITSLVWAGALGGLGGSAGRGREPSLGVWGGWQASRNQTQPLNATLPFPNTAPTSLSVEMRMAW